MKMKLKNLLASRKFWTMIASIVGVAGAWYNGQIEGTSAINAFVATLAAYSIATGIDDNGHYE